jgi:hypothetical protein
MIIYRENLDHKNTDSIKQSVRIDRFSKRSERRKDVRFGPKAYPAAGPQGAPSV